MCNISDQSRGYHEDLAVSKFLSGLSLTLRSQVQGQILGRDSISTLTANFSMVMRVSTRANVSSAPSIEQSAMVLDVVVVVAAILEDEDMDLLEADMAHMEADRVPLRKAPDNAGTVDAVIISPRSAGRNLVDLNGHNYLSLFFCLSRGLGDVYKRQRQCRQYGRSNHISEKC